MISKDVVNAMIDMIDENIRLIEEMAQFRNLLVHRYGKIDIRRVYIIMSDDLKDIQKFATSILKYIY
jgi:uncharacterized protein YutE (UPF0331/DUF86 family)